jgi:expansin
MKRESAAAVLVVSALLLAAACTAPPSPTAPPTPASAAPVTVMPTATQEPVEAASAGVASSAPAPSASAGAAVAVPAAVGSASVAAPFVGPEGKGEASFYTTNGKGACALNPPGNKLILSAAKDVYQKGDACGSCLEITGGAGTAIVQVMDICFTCPPGHVVISKPGYEAIVGKDSGTGAVSWKTVACPVGDKTPVSVRVKEGSTRDWTAVQIRDSKYAIKAVKMQRDGESEWRELTRAGDNYWSAAKTGGGDAGFKLQITGLSGQTIEEAVPARWKAGTVYPGTHQF